MAYDEFTLSGITKQFGLTIHETTDLYPQITEATLDPAFVARLADDVLLGAGGIHPESAL